MGGWVGGWVGGSATVLGAGGNPPHPRPVSPCHSTASLAGRGAADKSLPQISYKLGGTTNAAGVAGRTDCLAPLAPAPVQSTLKRGFNSFQIPRQNCASEHGV